MGKIFSNIGISIVIVLYIFSCDVKNSVDVSKVEVDFKSENFYKDFLQFDTTRCSDQVQIFQNKYPHFFNFYLDTLMNVGGINTVGDGLCPKISFLLNNKDLKFLADTINLVYPNLENTEAEILDMYRHVKYYEPQWQAPKVIFFDGGLRLWSVVMYQDFLGVGLDMYLGKDFQYYASRSVPEYMKYAMEPEQIPIQMAKVIYDDAYFFDINTASDFLQMMIESGKRILYLEYVIPNADGAARFAISPEKYQWMVDNEGEIYNYFIRQDMIYSTEMKDNLKYIQEAPHSQGMPAESPGQTGVFIGYRILKAYMEQTDASLMETIKNPDYKTLFERSKYKPL